MKAPVRGFCTALATTLISLSAGRGAELSVADTIVTPAGTATVVVSGDIAGESTFGVNILLEIFPRAGNTGTVEFTPEPPIDIVQLGDPWPAAGTFSTFDTLGSSSPLRNGSVDDSGAGSAPVTF